MSANFYDLLKCAATGIASPSMTYYDRMRASALMGGAVQTLTGIPPLSFKSDGTPLISLSMLGNGQQTGTPSPDNPVMPEFVGKMSAQIIPYPFYSPDGEYAGVQFTTDNGRIIASGTITSGLLYSLWRPAKFPAGTYTMSVKGKHSGATIYFRDVTNNVSVANIYGAQKGNRSTTFTITEEIRAMVYVNAGSGTIDFDCTIMLNAGDEALPFEPTNGYKISLTCAEQTIPVYLGEVPTVRRVKKLVFDGTEKWYKRDTPENSYYCKDVASPNPTLGICTHFARHSPVENLADGMVYFGATGISMRLDSAATYADFKSYLAAQYAAGTPVCVWYVLATPETAIVNEPLCKIGDYADELHSTDAGVTIPTVKGSNTLTVDTELQPSEMTITYRN